MFQNSHKILLSPIFLSGLFLLLLNDFFLKAEFHNFLTGKLSDFAGLFIFPLFFAAFFPKRKLEIYIFTGIFFIFWKSPFSQNLINLINSFGILKVGRTIDYTDLAALFILPVSFSVFRLKSKQENDYSAFAFKKTISFLVILLSVFTFTATTLVKDRSISFDKEYEISKSKSEIESILKNTKAFYEVKIRRDDEVFPRNEYPNVEVESENFFR